MKVLTMVILLVFMLSAFDFAIGIYISVNDSKNVNTKCYYGSLEHTTTWITTDRHEAIKGSTAKHNSGIETVAYYDEYFLKYPGSYGCFSPNVFSQSENKVSNSNNINVMPFDNIKLLSVTLHSGIIILCWIIILYLYSSST